MAEIEKAKTIKPGPECAYSGPVRALVKGFYGGSLRAEGDVFEISVPALWDDDWYEPIPKDGDLKPKRLPSAQRGLTPWNDVPVRDLKFN